ncbi:MAG TPA: glycosyltransferase family 4 protein, partial [bacterium]|nr:glycosyltransferase family 4 protein [bacterium]
AGDMEGFGLAALEAAICGLPVVASEIDGIVDAVQEGKNGFLLPPEEPELWAHRITGLLADPAGLRAAGEAAREFTKEHYSWERMVDGYEAVFKRFA